MYKFIFIMFFGILLLSLSWCKNEIKNNNKLSIENNKIMFHFLNPKNNLEKEINRISINFENDYKAKLKLAQLYLKYWSVYYKENTFAQKALNMLNNMKLDPKVDFLKWYAYEIQNKFNKALKEYKKVLSYKNLNKKEKANVINQIWHVYDLQGYMRKANLNYKEAEKIDPENIKILLNRWRYEARKGDFHKAIKYFIRILNKTNNTFLNSELYYDLSTLYLHKNIDKTIAYAKLWIKENKDYPGNYVALWTAYIMIWWKIMNKAPKELEKAIELYPNDSMAYKYLWIYYYIKNDFNNAIKNFKKQVKMSTKDIWLMANVQQKVKVDWEYDLARSYAYKWDIKNTLSYLDSVLLNSENKSLYVLFIYEYSSKNWPYSKIINNKEFKTEVKKIILKYNKK